MKFATREVAEEFVIILRQEAERVGYPWREKSAFVWPVYDPFCHECGRGDTFNAFEGTCYNMDCVAGTNQPVKGWTVTFFQMTQFTPLTDEQELENRKWQEAWEAAIWMAEEANIVIV